MILVKYVTRVWGLRRLEVIMQRQCLLLTLAGKFEYCDSILQGWDRQTQCLQSEDLLRWLKIILDVQNRYYKGTDLKSIKDVTKKKKEGLR